VEAPSTLARLVASLLREGQEEEARVLYARMPPVEVWAPPRYVLSSQLAMRLRAAIRLGLRRDVEQLKVRLEPVARWHVAPGSGTFITLGSGRLYTGLAAAFLGDLDRAIVDITKAVDDNARCDAITMTVVARQELAEVLVKRGRGSDLDRARRLASGVLEDARRLGMPPFVARASALLKGMPRRRLKSDELTSRELEVASLVAEGSTNRQIAVKLGVSERTVENHLDHVFRKLGLGGRAQLAAWVTTRITAGH
jgi:DNA-binding CsgD family transcriptional regulator